MNKRATFLIAIDEREPIAQFVADLRRAGFSIDYTTDPPTLRRADRPFEAPDNVVELMDPRLVEFARASRGDGPEAA